MPLKSINIGKIMGERIGCNLLNTRSDGRMPSDYIGQYHIHLLVHKGEMEFFDGKEDVHFPDATIHVPCFLKNSSPMIRFPYCLR